MKIAIFGGSFNPPHKGHLNSALYAAAQLKPDLFLVIPDFQPPHKDMAAGSPTPAQRLELCRLNFAEVPNVECSDIEISRGGKSYTADTLRQLREIYPDAELALLVGTDMFLNISQWYDAEYIFRNVTVAPFQRSDEEMVYLSAKAAELRERFNARVEIIASTPLAAASTDIRAALQNRGGTELLTDGVYSCIIRNRLYGAKVNFDWLREKSYAMLKPKRIPHVQGCEEEAVRLARRWGCDPEMAAEAAILHDCTKKLTLDGQLALCRLYCIEIDALERQSEKLLHSRTGAAVAEREFGCSSEIVDAIRWHTTGKPDMSLLEKIIYMADYIEPHRDFEGVEALRKLAYEDLDRAMLLGFEMSVQEISAYGNPVHKNTLDARDWYRALTERSEEK